MCWQVVYFKNGVVLPIDMESYEVTARFNELPNSFLRFVEFMGEWDRIEKVDSTISKQVVTKE
ncbi:MAG: hypothetical protein WC325_13415 [Candidatus Bathyarchaeia archaeon]|jgi:hypothetical protein